MAALRRDLAPSASPGCAALLAEHKASGQVIGFALYFYNYSTFLTRWGIYLEDLFVKPAFRGRGAGFGLLKRIAKIALEKGYDRLDCSVYPGISAPSTATERWAPEICPIGSGCGCPETRS